MNEPGHEQQSAPGKPGEVETTGHVWDGDLREYNNPLPRWWLWSFYATVVFSLIYWLLYPAWPIAGTYTKGIAWINYEVEGESQRSHWNSRALLVRDMQTGDAAVRQREFLQVIAEADHDTVLSDTDMLAFVNSYARGIFGDFCAACHQTGGAGIIGLYPNLADDNWHWGGTIQAIEQTITRGRMGYMPPYRETFDDQQADAVAAYVLSLAGHEGGDPEQVSLGGSIFQGYEGGCYACHGREGLGLKSQGAPNLTNDIWQNIDVTGAQSHAERQALVRDLILRGVQREMPAFGDRLSPAEIRVLATYVHQLGGGL